MIDFLGIGAQKSGTTWLMRNLERHPGVWTPYPVKELHYFDALYLGFPRKRRLRVMKRKYRDFLDGKSGSGNDLQSYYSKIVDPAFAFTDAWYEHIFRPAGQKIKGEFTPFYSALGKEGILHIQRIMPEVRLIYMIRDPYCRTISSLRMLIDRGRDKEKSLQELVRKPEFVMKGDYARNIPAWEEVFDPEQILYIPFGRVKSDPAAVLRDVESHLRLTSFGEYPFVGKKVHATGKRKKTTIPDPVKEIVRDMAAPQLQFLQERFGQEFLALMEE